MSHSGSFFFCYPRDSCLNRPFSANTTSVVLPKLNSRAPMSSNSAARSARFSNAKADIRINLGCDCRLSSPRLHDALLEGLLASGCDVTDVGVVPTPLLYFSAVHLKADGAS